MNAMQGVATALLTLTNTRAGEYRLTSQLQNAITVAHQALAGERLGYAASHLLYNEWHQLNYLLNFNS